MRTQTFHPATQMTKTKASRKRASLLTCLIFSALTASAVLQTACVTVNVNFPESAVQKATDDYVRDLYRAKEKGKSAPGQSTPSESKVTQAFSLISVAYADDFKVQSPKADAIKAKLASHLEELITQKRAGVIGESNNGLLVQKDMSLAPLLQKKVKGLIDEENSDRKDLYKEIVRINGLDSGRIDWIQKSFARSFQASSPSGTWVQDPEGNWSRKP